MDFSELMDTKIIVCDKCFTHSCFAGIFYCDDALKAGITRKTVRELLQLELENPIYISQGVKLEQSTTENPEQKRKN